MASTIQQFLREHGISEVEAIIPDMAGVARGKLMPAQKFAEEEGMRLPEAIFLQTVTGDYPEDQSAMNPSDIDIVLKADPKTVRVVPWAAEPTAQVIHESGAAQMEINLLHGYPMSLADQAFLFKRTAREAAMRHKMYATFMAKPMAKEPGSAMHLHQSIIDSKTRKNIFSNADGTPSELFFGHIAGLQKYLPGAMSLFCPNVNSYRRISRYSSAPINVHWGYDNRTAGLRVPMSGPDARRVENRVGGADANPYLAIAASLACGYLGMVEALKPSEPISGSASDLAIALPRTLAEALRLLRESKPLVDLFGDRFVLAYTAVKEAEYETFAQVISSWEREHLLLNV